MVSKRFKTKVPFQSLSSITYKTIKMAEARETKRYDFGATFFIKFGNLLIDFVIIFNKYFGAVINNFEVTLPFCQNFYSK